ncbi:MAG: manganese efflux pump [Clostridia bacterium]|nr:manganese efflux pump [Clostridia bacterium]
MGALFYINSMFLGVGLAMDAFSVSLANGLHEPRMRRRRMCAVAGVFAGFQFLMPLIGWFCVTTVTGYFKAFEPFVPWIAFGLLSVLGLKMLLEGVSGGEEEVPAVSFGALLLQGVATSIDALSVGFTIAEYSLWEAVLACLLIGAVTFVICFAGLWIGKRFGTKLSAKAAILGGAILVAIGIEILVTGLIG